jgi:hypothetical protein
VRKMDDTRKAAIIAICASILAARKLAAVPRNSPAYVAAISDAVADARRIVERIERDSGVHSPMNPLSPANKYVR